VKTLSNFDSPVIIKEGVQRWCRIDDVRQCNPVGVPVPAQAKDYCETFHKIDKGNMVEAKYDLGGNSKSHGWAPKLSYRFFNMGLNNLYCVYVIIHGLHNPGRRLMTMPEATKEATHTHSFKEVLQLQCEQEILLTHQLFVI